MTIERVKTKIGQCDLIIETGKFAKQASGAVTVQYGETVVLITAVASKDPRENVDFLPLTVEYQEKTYAAGKIPGGFFKREGRPSEKEILTARLIDRPIRPLFPKGFVNDMQIMAIVLSHDGQNNADVLAMIGASCALGLSNIPFPLYLGALRIGKIGDEFIINPTYSQLDESNLDLILAGTKDRAVMIEAGAKEVSEELILEAVKFGQNHMQSIIQLQEKLVKKCGKPKADFELKQIDKALLSKIEKAALKKIEATCNKPEKEEQEAEIDLICEGLIEEFAGEEQDACTEQDIKGAVSEIEKQVVRNNIIEKKKRADGRGFNDIRPITCEVSALPRTHGSGLFTRGQTQSLSIVTLGTGQDEQMIDALEGEAFKSFMLHYNFPSFSVGEVRPVRGPGRREIGHGALAERALKPILPSKEEFPYTIRVVSEILESNGSSSMASVCAGTLALMDAGVAIKAPVSGIAMGLVKEGKDTAILADIMGLEDHYGDMDFKVTGTEKGITAVQMDLKIDGITMDLLQEILEQSKQARQFILQKITEVIDKPRESVSEFAPKIINMRIDPSKIGNVIGPGGKIIRKIIEDTGVTIDIEDDGMVSIASTSDEGIKEAIDIVKSLTEDVEIGKTYRGKVTKLMNFGAFCEVLPGKEGLIHVSELDDKFVKSVEDVLKVGDEVMVKVIAIDQQGRVNLSRKQALKEKSE